MSGIAPFMASAEFKPRRKRRVYRDPSIGRRHVTRYHDEHGNRVYQGGEPVRVKLQFTMVRVGRDLVRGLRPCEGMGMLVPGVQESLDRVAEDVMLRKTPRRIARRSRSENQVST